MYEDQLPEDITQKEYDDWYAASRIEDGVRVGPEFVRQRPSTNRDVLDAEYIGED